MGLSKFIANPWQAAQMHPIYANSFLNMRPAPEYANGEVVLASTYRALGRGEGDVSESAVPKFGREFVRRVDRGRRQKEHEAGFPIDPSDWKYVVESVLRSPKQPNQASKRFLQLSPIVPDTTIYSLSARLSSNSWNPGALVSKVVQFGCPSDTAASDFWREMFQALDVDDDDDLWARFLDKEFKSWRTDNLAGFFSAAPDLVHDTSVDYWRRDGLRSPASRCIADLKSIIALKRHLTRRQWVSMLESVIRLGCASHVMWIARNNIQTFELLSAGLRTSVDDITVNKYLQSETDPFLRLGQYCSTPISDLATGFVTARLGINLLLHWLDEVHGPVGRQTQLSSPTAIVEFARGLSSTLDPSQLSEFTRCYQELLESDNRLIMGKKGISANIIEFLRHSLGQRQTSESGLENYDQGFYLAKRGAHKSARWEVSMGPVAVLSLVHACTYQRVGTTNVEDFTNHMAEYGIDINSEDSSRSSLGKTLRNLGLVLDSPDAEGGMAMISPFEMVLRSQG